MSPSHRCATAQKFPDFVQNFEICMCKLKIHDFINCLCFSSIFTHFMSMFRDFLAIFLRKVFKSKIVTEQTNPLLACLRPPQETVLLKKCSPFSSLGVR